ncbi:FAD:protein FMN transferase [Gramella lutea]|uniref:FAD:protein FMN transferase n=1 Tax=Christiangramia lutea TaxID=1607951 RepID=A0A9X1UZX7_9FLAO|nr:FAD:protein FMN transferase [Christiangramia lutea]MCH4821707.1 FAD:protein FMN transferase [Christiangramia lutea]
MKRTLILIVSVITLLSCNKETEVKKHEYYGEALGTTYSVQYFADEELQFKKAMDSIIDEINSSMSTYITKSDISKINRGDSSVVVDEHFKKVFNASDKIFGESDGFFDPTVGVLVNAYGFGPGESLKQIDSIQLDSLKNLVGFDKIRIEEDNSIQKEHSAIYLDFNAIAKGYTIDVVAEYLDSKGINNYLIELGGELRAKGNNLENEASWLVGVDDPNHQGSKRKLYAKVKLINAAMATSGNYRKYRTDSISGQKFVHTINPKTGEAERSNILSASVIAENCMLADGYATAFMAMGLDKTKAMLERINGVEAYIMYSKEDGGMEIFSTSGFEKNLVK